MQEEEDCRKYRRCILSSKAALYDSITLLIRFQRTWLWSKQLCHHLSGDIVVVVVSILILSLYLRAFSKYLRALLAYKTISILSFKKKSFIKILLEINHLQPW